MDVMRSTERSFPLQGSDRVILGVHRLYQKIPYKANLQVGFTDKTVENKSLTIEARYYLFMKMGSNTLDSHLALGKSCIHMSLTRSVVGRYIPFR